MSALLARVFTAVLALLAAQPAPAFAGVRGDYGWSADGLSYGTCDTFILPQSDSGCRFFSRDARMWITLGRREALGLWRPWEEQATSLLHKPILPVYPMQEREDDPGPVTLSGRLVPSDDVIDLWSLAGDVKTGDRGGDWATIFEYSPDGTWLAAGAVHVDHETSLNEFHVIVRPVSEWLALARVRLAVRALASGRIRTGLSHIEKARAYMEEGWVPGSLESSRSVSPLGDEYFDDDEVHLRTFVRWSTDGRTLCSCEAWRDYDPEVKARCQVIQPPEKEWTPVVVSLVHTHCPGYGKPPQSPSSPPPLKVWADGGFDGKTGAVVVYLTGGSLGTGLGAVMERTWDARISRADGYPAFFHPVAEPSPDGKWLALGYLEQAGPESDVLHHEILIDTPGDWVEMARAEAALHERTDPVELSDARPELDLAEDTKADGPGSIDQAPAVASPEQGGCGCGQPG